MWLIIFKICFVLSITTATLAKRAPQVVTNISNGFSSQIQTAPFVEVGNKLYFISADKASWHKANLICVAMGGTLASIDNDAEMTALSNYLISYHGIHNWWWLSGSDLHEEGSFAWYGTGEPFKNANSWWSANQPDNDGNIEHCVHLWNTGVKYEMNDWNCDQLAYYICETEKPKTISVTIW